MGFSIPEQKFYFHEEFETRLLGVGPQHEKRTQLDDYTSNKSYSVDYVTPGYTDGNCTLTDISGSLDPLCLPGNIVTLLNRGVFGDKNLPVSTYSFPYDVDTPAVITMYIDDTVKPRQCRPVYIAGLDPSSYEMMSYHVVDLGPITSRGIFDVPKACRNMTQPRQKWVLTQSCMSR